MTKKELNLSLLAENPRASLASWLRFRDHVIQAIEWYPQSLILHPISLRPSTYTSRVRDAIRGAIAFGYPCGTYSTDALLTWYTQISVRFTKTTVIIGPRDAVEEIAPNEVKPISLLEDAHRPIGVSPTERDAIVVLVGSGRLASGVTLATVWPGWQPDNPNVIATVKDGKTILI